MKPLTFEDIFGPHNMDFLKNTAPDEYNEYVSIRRAINTTAKALVMLGNDKLTEKHNLNAQGMAIGFARENGMNRCDLCKNFIPSFWPCEFCFHEDGTPKKKQEKEEEKK